MQRWSPLILSSVGLWATLPLPTEAQVTQAPKLKDAKQAATELDARYPSDLRLLSIGGRVYLEVQLGKEGAVDSVAITTSSGIASLDEAAKSAARRFRFSGGRPGLWIQLPLEFTPDDATRNNMSQLPQLLNRKAVQDSAWSRIPDNVRTSNIRARVAVAISVDSTGRRVMSMATPTSCLKEFDAAALAAVQSAQFTPQEAPGKEARRTVLTFEFLTDAASILLPGEVKNPERQVADSTGTPAVRSTFTVAPKLRNRSQVAEALGLHYPEDLRDSGIGGTVSLWVFIDERGNVIRRRVQRTSGMCGLDIAALAVADAMKFTPALADRKPTRVWVDMPIVFKVR